MNSDIRAVHFSLDDDQKDIIEKKMHRLDFAKDYLVDFQLTITLQKKEMTFDAQLHFKWGTIAHVSHKDYEFLDGVDKLFDALSAKVHKEKAKIQDYSV